MGFGLSGWEGEFTNEFNSVSRQAFNLQKFPVSSSSLFVSTDDIGLDKVSLVKGLDFHPMIRRSLDDFTGELKKWFAERDKVVRDSEAVLLRDYKELLEMNDKGKDIM